MADNFETETDVYEGIDYEAAATDALDTVAIRVLNAWQNYMLDAGYKNTGDTINSLTVDDPAPLERVIGSDRVAALIGEFGRAPGAGHPPPDDLGDWVHEQDGLPNRGETVEWDFGDGHEEVTFDQVVYLIGKSIDENGLPAHHFGERAARDHEGDLEREINANIQAQLDDQTSK